jgi:uncharacterized membrane protein
MSKGRLEAFSDGVLAIIITIMVLEMKVPQGDTWAALKEVSSVFISYILSFITIGIYWNNHHHMLHASKNVNGAVLWANVHLLFWLSLLPFVTGWMGKNHFTLLPVALYGIILFMAGLAYYILSMSLIKLHGKKSTLALAIGKDKKGLMSIVVYAIAVALCWVSPKISLVLYALVTGMWLVPDKRIENKLKVES